MFRIVRRAVLILVISSGIVQARTIYVDSRVGNDAYDGTASQALNAYVGPVRTLSRAMQLVRRGDSVVLADNGVPYYDSLTFFGPCFSGADGVPFRLIGNGAVVSGAKPVAPQSWEELGNQLWRLTPIRKGHVGLIRDGQTLPRVELPWPAESLPNLPVGAWGVSRGTIYYKSDPADDPRWHEFALADADTGLTLLNVRDVVISNVTFQHFRIDGINAHDRCRGIVLDNVTSLQNGRAGITLGGTSRVQLRSCRLSGSYDHSLLITERGEADVQDTELDRPPTLAH